MRPQLHDALAAIGSAAARLLAPAWLGVSMALAASAAGAAGEVGKAAALLEVKCGACHLEEKGWQRITDIRKTPEGWDMTLVRMGIWHKVELTRTERKALVKYLADRQGLAPEESSPQRALIERQPNSIDVSPSEELTQMCGRCHSVGRVALQRRDAGEWRKLIHTHVGQFPSIEYSSLGRDREWFELAQGDLSRRLGEMFPLHSAAWRKWQATKATPPTGRWRVAGHRPGWGEYAGFMEVAALGDDRYDVSYELNFDAGNTLSGRGESVVYTGYEWRGRAQLGNQDTLSVFAISPDGKRMTGRWFLRKADEIGARFTAIRIDAAPAGTILAVSPALLKAGETSEMRVAGVSLGERFDLGPGVKVSKVRRVSEHEVRLVVSVAADATVGWRSLGAAAGPARVAVYRQIDRLRVEPEFAYARLGGGTAPPVTAQFEAIAYLDGPDGKPDTDDDIRLGPVNAQWSVDNRDERAKAEDDARFAGVMEPHGQFIPAPAGANPLRNGNSNTGDLLVIARLADGARSVSGSGRLVVTAQRWNTPPLR